MKSLSLAFALCVLGMLSYPCFLIAGEPVDAQGRRFDLNWMIAPVHGPQKADNLLLEVEFEAGDFLLGEPIFVRSSLVNRTEQPIDLSYGGERQGYIQFDIVGADGKPVPPHPELRDSPGPELLELPAGKRIVQWHNLADEYGLGHPGSYDITVRFDSDGKPGDLWKGKLAHKLGKITIKRPQRAADRAALEALSAKFPQGFFAPDPEFRFVYLFEAGVDRASHFDEFLGKHGQSGYAVHARFANARAALSRPKTTAAAIKQLEAIDPKPLPPLFAERRLLYLVWAHEAASSPPAVIAEHKRLFIKRYPHSPHRDFRRY